MWESRGRLYSATVRTVRGCDSASDVRRYDGAMAVRWCTSHTPSNRRTSHDRTHHRTIASSHRRTSEASGPRCRIGLAPGKGPEMPNMEERLASLEGKVEILSDVRREMHERFTEVNGRFTDMLEVKVDRHFVWLMGVMVTLDRHGDQCASAVDPTTVWTRSRRPPRPTARASSLPRATLRHTIPTSASMTVIQPQTIRIRTTNDPNAPNGRLI